MWLLAVFVVASSWSEASQASEQEEVYLHVAESQVDTACLNQGKYSSATIESGGSIVKQLDSKIVDVNSKIKSIQNFISDPVGIETARLEKNILTDLHTDELVLSVQQERYARALTGRSPASISLDDRRLSLRKAREEVESMRARLIANRSGDVLKARAARLAPIVDGALSDLRHLTVLSNTFESLRGKAQSCVILALHNSHLPDEERPAFATDALARLVTGSPTSMGSFGTLSGELPGFNPANFVHGAPPSTGGSATSIR